MALTATDRYFRDFFDEKDVDEWGSFVIVTDANEHRFTYGAVIEAIKQTTGREAQQIASTLRRIDFANGDVTHYLRYLARALAANYDGSPV